MAPRRWLLRERTADAHRRLDSLVVSWTSIDDYRFYLSSMYRFRAGIEQELSKHRLPDAFGHWHWAEITGLIGEDLADLDVERPVPIKTARPLKTSEFLGALYVLEGSSVGAQLLFRRAVSLGLSGRRGARHLELLNNRVDQWRAFLVGLEAVDAEEAAVVSGAMTAFALATEAFRPATEDTLL
jgi:heme oxygenase